MIFDEVHYVNDMERGVVWEEVIIMLPAHVNFVFLSATVPNVVEFADWVGRTKKKPIHVITTEKRVVPLQHFLWAKNKLFNVLDHLGRFHSEAFKNAKLEGVTDKKKQQERSGFVKRTSFKQIRNGWLQLINYLKKNELLPAVIFAFSKKICQDCAFNLTALDLTSQQEKSEITTLTNSALSRLHTNDRKLPQVLAIKELIRRGLGIHHAGMLPILKELVEMVFSRGLIKVLFATETFAMGVNFPTKTSVFYSTRKHDGNSLRDLLPGEYTQMAGRAGRRGLDNFGIVIINCRNDEIPEEGNIKTMLTGKSTRLESKFRLTYNMILNLLRQEDMRVEDMIKRSFGEVFLARDAPKRKQLLKKCEVGLSNFPTLECNTCTKELVENISELFIKAKEIYSKMLLVSCKYNFANWSKNIFVTGRVLVVNKFNIKYAPAVILKIPNTATNNNNSNFDNNKKSYICFVLCPPGESLDAQYAQKAKELNITIGKPFKPNNSSVQLNYFICEILVTDILAVVEQRIEVDAAGILIDHREQKINGTTQDLFKFYQSNAFKFIPNSNDPSSIILMPHRVRNVDLLKDITFNTFGITGADDDSSNHMAEIGILDEQLQRIQILKEAEFLLEQVLQIPSASGSGSPCPNIKAHLDLLENRHSLERKCTELRRLLADDNLSLIDDFSLRLKILEKLTYIDSLRTVKLKGRVACEINTCDSLILTELIFENHLSSLEPEEILSVLSCLIFQEKNADDPILNDKLLEAKKNLDNVCYSLGSIQLECGMDIIPAEYVRDSLNPGLMQVVYEWARGTSFQNICTLTNVLEGSIVRCITRLDETCRDVRGAARVIGDATLYAKMTRASELIKRDIVFAASLYVS